MLKGCNHVEGVHKNLRNHVCGECGYAASYNGDLKKHVEGVHKNMRGITDFKFFALEHWTEMFHRKWKLGQMFIYLAECADQYAPGSKSAPPPAARPRAAEEFNHNSTSYPSLPPSLCSWTA